MQMSSFLQRREPEQGGGGTRVLAAAEGAQAHWAGCCTPSKMFACLPGTATGTEVPADVPTSKLQGGH